MVGFQSMKGFDEQARAFDGVEENAKLRQELFLDQSFEINAECRELLVDDDQKCIKCFRGDVRPKTDHPPEALGPHAYCSHEDMYRLDPVDSLFSEFLDEFGRKIYVAFHLHDSLGFFAVGPRYASGCGDTTAYPPDDSKALFLEQFCGFTGGKNFFDDLTPPLALVDSMRDCLNHTLGAAEVLLVAVGIGCGFDYGV
jgi:hypothetical protein